MKGARGLLAEVVRQEIVEAYDLVESILGRISIAQRPEVEHELAAAKDHLFRARVLSGESDE